MMKAILIPTDFSPNANKALDFAVQIAKKASAKIIIIHACDLFDITFKDRIKTEEEYNQKIIVEATTKLKMLKESIEGTEQLVAETQLYKGSAQDTILLAAGEYHADLIVMGTLGDSAIKEKIFGSKTAGIIGKSKAPVLAVPLLSEWYNPETISLAVNNFEEKPGITALVFELAGLFKAKVQVALFTDKIAAGSIDYLQDERNISAYEIKIKAKYKNININASHLDGYNFQDTLDSYIAEEKVDMLAMVTHKRNFLEGIFNRSMTRKMSYHTRIPLLALPA